MDAKKDFLHISPQQKRVGILTLYYRSANYGGLLQAYALCIYMNNQGYYAQQIPYNYYGTMCNINISPGNPFFFKKVVLYVKKRAKKFAIKICNRLNHIVDQKEKYREVCREFRENMIPHNSTVYDNNTIKKVVSQYDVFITGSDQVWNPGGYRKEYFLEFVNDKPKISYAASVSNQLSEFAQKIYQKNLSSFTTISVREKSDIKIISSLTDKKLHWVLDPVFLLTTSEWEDIAEIYNQVQNIPFIFCYFLGNNKMARKLVTQFAQEHNLTILTIPYLQGDFRLCDKKFGDIRAMDATPNNFLWLIKNASYVFTDSFHATAFSIIFKKQFVVFRRRTKDVMAERIVSLTELCGSRDRFCKDENIEYIYNAVKESTDYITKEFRELLQESKRILEI